MSRRPVVAPKNLRSNLPFVSGITCWLFLDRLDVPGYVHGIVWTLFGIVVVAVLAEYWTTVATDIFKEKNDGEAT